MTNECRDRKVNPQSWDEAVQVANVLGVRCLCVFNDHRERLLDLRTVDCETKARLRDLRRAR